MIDVRFVDFKVKVIRKFAECIFKKRRIYYIKYMLDLLELSKYVRRFSKIWSIYNIQII